MSNIDEQDDNGKSRFSQLLELKEQLHLSRIALDEEYKSRKRRAYEIDRYCHVMGWTGYGITLADEIVARNQAPKHVRVGIKQIQKELKMIERCMTTLRRV